MVTNPTGPGITGVYKSFPSPRQVLRTELECFERAARALTTELLNPQSPAFEWWLDPRSLTNTLSLIIDFGS